MDSNYFMGVLGYRFCWARCLGDLFWCFVLEGLKAEIFSTINRMLLLAQRI